MKIGILGCRGIPNAYGGFEQFAEYLSKGLAEKGHEVYVYNSHTHPYQEKEWNGVQIIHCYDPEHKLGTAGQFIYDFNCIRDSHKRNFDIILQLGYTSNSIWGHLLPKKSIIITNMDGLEWKRSKYSKNVQRFLQWAEKKAIDTSDYLVADSLGIQKYLQNKYQVTSHYIPYGAHLFNTPEKQLLEQYNVTPHNYSLLIARLEPENNIEAILSGYDNSNSSYPFLVIGKHTTKFGEYLKEQFSSNPNIRFLGGIYNMNHLNNLRNFSTLYFHGHSVGGTNPSLLEAMASKALICAHRNSFNQAILEKDAFYFKNNIEITKLINTLDRASETSKVQKNFNKISTRYRWSSIINSYEQYMMRAYNEVKKEVQLQSLPLPISNKYTPLP